MAYESLFEWLENISVTRKTGDRFLIARLPTKTNWLAPAPLSRRDDAGRGWCRDLYFVIRHYAKCASAMYKRVPGIRTHLRGVGAVERKGSIFENVTTATSTHNRLESWQSKTGRYISVCL